MQHKIKRVIISSEQTIQQNSQKKTIQYIHVLKDFNHRQQHSLNDEKISNNTFPRDRYNWYMNMIRLL